MLTGVLIAVMFASDAVVAGIRPHHGAPTVHINGKPDFPFAFLMHTGDFDKEYRQMADIGVRFFTMGAGIGATPGGFDPAECDGPFEQILKQQPEALLFPRVGVTAPPWWLDAHPGDRVVFDDGSVGPQSMFSEAWIEDACRWIEDYSRHIRTAPYADHVIGIHICSGETAEWQSWGLWSDRRGDFSPVALEAWRTYLAGKYGNDADFSAAWGRDVTIETAEIPSRARRETEGPFLRQPPEYQDVFDFYDYYWRGAADAIEALAAAAKRGGGQDWLVGFFYGYAIQYGGKMQESQHLGMRRVMDCPDIDFFCSPAMYSLRAPGGTSTFMSFTESIRMRGKLWWDEADNRTHLAQNNVAPAADLFDSLNVLEREFAHAVTRRAGIWWFDMQGGWYDDPAILDLLGQMREFGETNEGAWDPKAEVALFIDDKSSYRIRPEEPFLHDGITQFLSEIPRFGAPYDTFLLSDVGDAGHYKVRVFLLAFDLTNDERAAIDELKRDGATLVFVGPAGVGRYQDGRTVHDPALTQALLGVTQDDIPAFPETLDMRDWRLAWTPGPRISLEDLRTVARQAGVHLYHDQDDAFYAGNGLITLHARTAGDKTLRFPESVSIRELFAEDPIVFTGQNLTFPLRANETRCFTVTR